jgi:hypothetical protein
MNSNQQENQALEGAFIITWYTSNAEQMGGADLKGVEHLCRIVRIYHCDLKKDNTVVENREFQPHFDQLITKESHKCCLNLTNNGKGRYYCAVLWIQNRVESGT